MQMTRSTRVLALLSVLLLVLGLGIARCELEPRTASVRVAAAATTAPAALPHLRSWHPATTTTQPPPTTPPTTTRHSTTSHRARAATPPAAQGSGHCGGDLPPCWVMNRESGGNLNAYNPTGCGGRGCYGKWQCDPHTCSGHGTEAQQDAEARALWNNGKGCSHWDAC